MEKTLTLYRVIYGDTDQMGVAYYANYLRWFEMGRTDFLRQTGVPYTSIEAKGLRFPVTEVSCRYLRPARYDEGLIIETTLTSLGRATLAFSYRVYQQEDKLLVATGWTKHACADREGRITKIPSTLETILKAKISPLSK